MIAPYLVFHGECREALAFYRGVFRCDEPNVLPYGDYMPEGSKTPPELLRGWVMHAEMVICGTNAWFADEAFPAEAGNRVRLTATVPTGAEAREVFAALSAGGEVTLEPTETFYSVFHASVTDRFGVNWNVVAEEAPKEEDAP